MANAQTKIEQARSHIGIKDHINKKFFVGTAESEHVEMYLKAMWHLKETGEQIKVNKIAKILNVRQPSVVQMLKRLNAQNLVIYNKTGVTMTENGERIAAKMIRNSRLLEMLMTKTLKMDINAKMVCGMEHHMDDYFADALCTLLGHPEKSPRGEKIPRGNCCERMLKES
ncbi:MAG: metal-dependent transcriptional regulator [Thaumarchaeota archaeon]|nr:metal-dependent transcriptional regulator [Nitrososphaerota archaeon]